MAVQPVTVAREIAADPSVVFQQFIHPGSWWPLSERNVLGAGSRLAFEGTALIERRGAESAQWGEVVEQRAPEYLELAFHPSLPRSAASRLEVRFDLHEAGALVTLIHSDWGHLQGDASILSRGWTEVLASLADHVSRAALRIACTYHEAWTAGEFKRAAELLAPEVAIEVPVNEYPTRESFATALSGFGSMASGVRLVSALGDEQEAMLLYDMDVQELGEFRVAEHFTVAGEEIVRLRQIHDTAPIRAAGMAS